MKLRYILPLFVAVMGLFASCADEDQINNLDNIVLSQSSVAIPQTGGSATITVAAKDSWTLTKEGADWLTVSATSGNAGNSDLTFSAEGTEDARTAEALISCGGKTQHVVIIQGKAGELSISTCAQVAAGPDKTYRIKGVVENIANTTYGNYYVNDGTGSIYVYGTLDKNGAEKNFSSLGIEAGDIVDVQGPKSVHNGTVELVNVTVLSIEKSLIKADSTMVDGVKGNLLPKEGGDLDVYLTVKGDGLNFKDLPSWLSVSKLTQNGQSAIATLHAVANEAGDREATVTFTTKKSGKEYTTTVKVSQKGSILPATIAEFNAAAKGAQYRLTGIVTKIDATKKFFMIKDYSGETEVYGAKDAAGNAFDVAEGDLVTVVGKRDAYKTTIEMTGYTIEDKKATTEVTVTEFLTKEDSKTVYYRMTGTVKSFKKDGENYGNLYLTDGTSEVYVYGLVRLYNNKDAKTGFVKATGLKAGDTITITGYKDTYNGTVEVVDGYCVEM